jgi:hypothetical protein
VGRQARKLPGKVCANAERSNAIDSSNRCQAVVLPITRRRRNRVAAVKSAVKAKQPQGERASRALHAPTML